MASDEEHYRLPFERSLAGALGQHLTDAFWTAMSHVANCSDRGMFRMHFGLVSRICG